MMRDRTIELRQAIALALDPVKDTIGTDDPAYADMVVEQACDRVMKACKDSFLSAIDDMQISKTVLTTKGDAVELVREMYEWTRHKDSPWAKRAKALLDREDGQ